MVSLSAFSRYTSLGGVCEDLWDVNPISRAAVQLAA